MKQAKNEPIAKIMVVEADDFEEVTEVTEGNIAAVSGLKVRFKYNNSLRLRK